MSSISKNTLMLKICQQMIRENLATYSGQAAIVSIKIDEIKGFNINVNLKNSNYAYQSLTSIESF